MENHATSNFEVAKSVILNRRAMRAGGLSASDIHVLQVAIMWANNGGLEGLSINEFRLSVTAENVWDMQKGRVSKSLKKLEGLGLISQGHSYENGVKAKSRFIMPAAIMGFIQSCSQNRLQGVVKSDHKVVVKSDQHTEYNRVYTEELKDSAALATGGKQIRDIELETDKSIPSSNTDTEEPPVITETSCSEYQCIAEGECTCEHSPETSIEASESVSNNQPVQCDRSSKLSPREEVFMLKSEGYSVEDIVKKSKIDIDTVRHILKH